MSGLIPCVICAVTSQPLTARNSQDYTSEVGKHTNRILSRAAQKKRLREGEVCAVTLHRPKTAALLFDRVYCADPQIPYDLTPGWTRSPGGIIETGGSANRVLRFGPNLEQLENDIRDHAPTLMDFIARHGFRPVPYYETLDSLDSVYAPGDTSFIGLALEDVIVVDEEQLEWNQVVEFRSDEDSAADYRRLVHWFDSTMKEKELTFVQDELASRYEKYKAALKKHGLLNRIGEILSMWTSLQALGSAGIGTLLGSVTSPPIGVIAAIAMLDALTSAKIREIKRDERHARKYGELGELAFVHKINAMQRSARR